MVVVDDGDGGIGDDAVTVTVLSFQQATLNIIINVQGLIDGTLNQRDASGLIRKLEQAITKLDRGKFASAISKLQDFIAQVNDFISAGKLTAAEGQPLIDAAQEIIASLGG